MGLLSVVPDFMKKGSNAKPAQGNVPPPPPAPVTGLQSVVTAMPSASSYGQPPTDQVLTDKIIGMVTETVPSIKSLLAEADKLKAIESDFGKRLNTVMLLKGFTSAQASDATLALTRALDGVRQHNEGEIAAARADQVEKPKQKITELGARKQALQAEIAQIDAEVSTTSERVAQAEARIQAEHAKLQGSVEQARAWIDSLARLITKS